MRNTPSTKKKDARIYIVNIHEMALLQMVPYKFRAVVDLFLFSKNA